MKKNLLDLDLQLFADEVEDTGVNEVEEAAVPEGEEASEEETVETGETEEDGNAEPEQSPEENARYAAIRRRAEEDARKKYDAEMARMNQQIAAMCQGSSNPITGKPITNVREYIDALSAQQKMESENELKEKGIDPGMIDRMIAQNPIVMQAQQVIEQTKMTEAESQLQRDLAEVSKYDPNIKGINDLAALPNFPEMVALVERNNLSLLEAYKMVNFDNFMQHTNEAARQQAINQMRGKSHLPSQTQGVATENDDVEVPAEIMARFKADGKSEKQIKELYKRVPH